MKLATILLVPFMLSAPALCQVRTKLANYGTVSFDCNNMPEVCVNMCFGAHCRGGRYGKTFTYDPNGNQNVRRKAAGCGPNNRCATTPPWKGNNLSCDEFPFANSREADTGGQNNRCVPAGENNRQGGTFGAFLSRVRAAQGPKADTTPYLYNIAFTNTPGVKYCSNQGAGTCDADANMWIGTAPAGNGGNWVNPFRKRDLVQPTYNHYISKRGEFFTSVGEMSPGDKLYHARTDPVLEARALKNADKDARDAFYANPDNYEMVEDEMERPATSEEVANLA